MNVEIKGHVVSIGEIQHVGQKNTAKRTMIVQTEEKYPQTLAVDFMGKATDKLPNYSEGMRVIIKADIRGSAYNGKHYTNLSGWDIAQDGNPVQEVEGQLNQAGDDLLY